MLVGLPSTVGDGGGGGGFREAESLLRTKPIFDIRNVEAATRKQIQDKSEELRQLVGNRYRDLIDSADSIVLMKSCCESISVNISAVHSGILHSLSASETPNLTVSPNPARARIYGVACRVKYLVDTPENIWGCLDESMFLEAAARYIRAKQVHHSLVNNANMLSNFPLLQHQWQIVESFKAQICQWSRERLLDHALGLGIGSYADALAAVALIDELDPKQVLSLFLDSRKSCIYQKLNSCSTSVACSDFVSAFCEVMKIIQISVGQVGELFLQVLNDMPLFYKVILGSPPVSQLFGGIPNPDEEVSKQVLEGSLEWLKSVFGSDIELPWNRIRELVLEDDAYLWDEIFEDAFGQRMKAIIDSGFDDLNRVVNLTESIRAIAETPGDWVDFQAYLNRSSMAGGVWFVDPNSKKAVSLTASIALPEENDIRSCLNAYFGAEVSRIRDTVDNRCESVLEDLLSFLESPKPSLRLKYLVPYLQNKCYESISILLLELKSELERLSAALESGNREGESIPPPAIIVESSLFIGQLLFAFEKHSQHIPMILGSPRLWDNETLASLAAVSDKSPTLRRHSRVTIDSVISDSPIKKMLDSSKGQTSLVTAAFIGVDDSLSPQLEELNRITRGLCIRGHNLWISWVSDELSVILSRDLRRDDGLSTSSPLRGWEETVVKQEQSNESQSEMKISLPSMPSLYITSFQFRACEEIHRVGGHVLNKLILQKFALTLLEKVSAWE
ncbi:hypothetical protein F0562_012117 [Nyssa sinensis]|uniref:Conserved oligomeric Golgi complex subunit 1 n=1 Tax=Nyssa sinensis TaxID=561372 RepID=A0A5J4ZSM8_9ASTE|nr:hypothetical protein F0562_012117 [Nyssa sinensis]